MMLLLRVANAEPVTKQTVLPNGMKVIVREDHTAGGVADGGSGSVAE